MNTTLGGNPTWVSGHNQGAISFNGTVDMVTVPNAADLNITGDLTIAFWMNKASSSYTGYRRLVGKGDYSKRTYEVWLDIQTDRILFQQVDWSTGIVRVQLYSTQVVPVGAWLHVAAVVSGNAVSLYWNGTLQNSATRTGPPVLTDYPLRLGYPGADGAGGDPYHGLLDDVRLYNRALSGAEIASLAGAANQAPTVNAGPDQSIVEGQVASLSGQVSDDGLPVGGGLTTAWSKVTGPGTVTFGNPNVQVTTASFSAVGTYVLRLTASDSLLSASDDLTVVVNPAGGLVAYWKLDETSGTTAVDSSGYGHTGTLGGSPTWVSGHNQGALSFNGTADMVTVPNVSDLSITGDLTIAFWMNKTSSSYTGYRRLVGKGDAARRTYEVWLDYQTEKILFQQLDWSTGIIRVQLYSTQTVPVGSWLHIAAVVTGNAVSLYWNGTLQSSATRTGPPVLTDYPLRLGYPGSDGAQGDPYHGLLDDVRIYNRALSAAEIGAFVNSDGDGDGLPDSWESQYFGNLNQDGQGDWDADGVTNLQHYQRGTDPTATLGLQVFTPFQQ